MGAPNEMVDALLKQIQQWRNDLAGNLATGNADLSQRAINVAVQMTMERIVFLRLCEDRGSEPYGRLKSLAGEPMIYSRLGDLFRQADDRYNSGLFHFVGAQNRNEEVDRWTLSLKIDDRVLKNIIDGLYDPKSMYDFSALSADILGQVYEQFLGKVIRLTNGHQATIEDKPEIKRTGGVFYTPTNIVDHIVRETIGKLVANKESHEVAGRTKSTWKPARRGRPLSVLDPACGSGSFLIGAYQFLLDWYRERYVDQRPLAQRDRIFQAEDGQWRLTAAERKRILLDHIHGVDIDRHAVEVTKLSLLLKLLEGENQKTIRQPLHLFRKRALPNLANNIKCGNSLVSSDVYHNQPPERFDECDRLAINAFDWHTEFTEIVRCGGFDAVIGNPPYDVLEKNRGQRSRPHALLGQYLHERPEFRSALGGKLNLFRFFMVRSLQLVRQHGRFGNIVPLAILADISSAQSRRHLMLNTDQIVCECFPQKDNPSWRIFERAKLSTMIVTCRRRESVPVEKAGLTVRVYPRNRLTDDCKEAQIKFVDTQLLDSKNTPIPLVDGRDWDLCRRIHGNPRVVRLGEAGEYVIRRGEINQTVFREWITDDPRGVRLLKGVEVAPFHLREKLSQGKREWFDETRFLQQSKPKPIADQRRLAIQRITGVDERLRIVGTLVEPRTYFADSTNSISAAPDSSGSLLYLLGLLNSRLFQWRFKLTSTNNNVGTNELESMPLRRIDVANPTDIQKREHVVGLVDQMFALHRQMAAARTDRRRTSFGRQVASTGRELDQAVYQLYDLTSDDIQIVEGEAPS